MPVLGFALCFGALFARITRVLDFDAVKRRLDLPVQGGRQQHGGVERDEDRKERLGKDEDRARRIREALGVES